MSPRETDGRALIFGLAAMLLIGLLAWSPDILPAVHAERLNQTIPTPTPQGQPTGPPSNTVPSPGATQPESPPPKVRTPVPTSTGVPAPVQATGPATTGPVTEAVTAAITEPDATETVLPTTADEIPEIPAAGPETQSPEEPARRDPVTTEAGPPAEPVATLPASMALTPTLDVPVVDSGTMGEEQTLTKEWPLAGVGSLSCLWLGGGLVLIGAGAFVLRGRRGGA